MKKPQVNTFGHWLSHIPAKSYLFHLMRADIEACAPARSLDAGCGELRNFWMFPGEYVGITHNRAAYFRGLQSSLSRPNIQLRGEPATYLMRLERDFSFLGLFDLVVCTQTLMYVEDRFDVVRRLASRVRRGGTLLFEDAAPLAERYRALLQPMFETVDIIYWGVPEALEKRCVDGMPATWSDQPSAEWRRLYDIETAAPNTPEANSRVYIRALRKVTEDLTQASAPAMTAERALRIVDADRPYLRLDD